MSADNPTAEFVLARISEDEVTARYSVCPCGGPVCTPELGWFGKAELESRLDGSERAIDHVIAWSPARVLAECAAKRGLIELVLGWKHHVSEDCWYTCPAATDEVEGETCCNDAIGYDCNCGVDNQRDRVLMGLAAAYSAHPDFDARWSS